MPKGIAEIKAVLALVATNERYIRYKMYPPLDAYDLDGLRRLLLDLSGRLTEIAGLGHEVSSELLETPAEILESLEQYRGLAEQYYDRTAQEARRTRPTHLVAPEIEAVAAPSKKLKRDVLAYLQALREFLDRPPR